MLAGAIGIYEYQHFILNWFLKYGCSYLCLSWNLMVCWESVWNLDRKERLYIGIWAVDLFYKLKALFMEDMDPEIRESISTFWVLMPYLAISHNLRKKSLPSIYVYPIEKQHWEIVSQLFILCIYTYICLFKYLLTVTSSFTHNL